MHRDAQDPTVTTLRTQVGDGFVPISLVALSPLQVLSYLPYFTEPQVHPL